MLFSRGKRRLLMDYLEEESHSYPQIFENSPDILLFVVDLQGRIVNLRGGKDHLFGTTHKEVIGKKFSHFVYEQDLKKVQGYFDKVFNGITQYVNYRVTSTNGKIIYIDVTLVPIQLSDNEVIGLYGLARNISDTIKLKHAVNKSQDQLQSLLSYSEEVIGILDRDGVIILQSPSVKKVLGYSPDEITKINAFELVHPDDFKIAKSTFNKMVHHPREPFTLVLKLKHKNGEWGIYKVTCTNHLDNENINGIICNLHDITELKKKQQEIQYMANHDYLTELPNRWSFENRLDLEVRLANVDRRKFAVLFLNLDGFKFLNDSLGYDIGDQFLIKIANHLTNSLSANLEVIARMGNKEFAIITKGIQNVSAVEQIAKNILKNFEQSFTINSYHLYVTSSIGISIYPESGKDTSTLMKNASLALYLAEKAGTNNYRVYSPTANIGTYKMFTIRNDLQQALQNDQFLLYYQPIFQAKTNEIVSVEALLRWNHPELGMIPPDEFIPLAEESGLIILLGEWVLQTVCKNLRNWHDAGYLIKASINLSFIQFLQPNLIEMIKETIQNNQLEPKWINIEVTESAMIQQEVKVLEKVEQMRKMGIKISLDDFGTGYASFKKIMDLKPDILKIDKSLVNNITTDDNSKKITTSIIDLAHKLSMKVVVEGVETKEQFKFLSKLECDFVQGYFFSRPVSKKGIEKILAGLRGTIDEPPQVKERRKYFRVELEFPLEASMTVTEMGGKSVKLGNTKILLEDIGPGGLCFLSNINLPTQAGIILKFIIKVLGEEMMLYGTIAHNSEHNNLYRYGVEFKIGELDREHLIRHFNQFQLQLNRNPILKDHPFVTDNKHAYFEKL